MNFLHANWKAPQFVRACTTTSDECDKDYNIRHDNTREWIKQRFDFKEDPAWLHQTHSNICINVDITHERQADASMTRMIKKPLVVLTADCLPILISHRHRPEIAAIHAGWKGLFNGIIERTIANLSDVPKNYMVWFGPAICQQCYGISDTFRLDFLNQYPHAAHCFEFRSQWHFSLTQMAQYILNKQGIEDINHSNACTFENENFYSYRRSQGTDGRIATFIWLEDAS